MDYTQNFKKFAKQITVYDPDQLLCFSLSPSSEVVSSERKKTADSCREALKPYLGENMSGYTFVFAKAKASDANTIVDIAKINQMKVSVSAIGHTGDVYPHPIDLPENERLYDHAYHFAANLSEKVKAGLKADFAKYGAALVEHSQNAAALKVTIPPGQTWDQLEQELIKPLLMNRVTKVYRSFPPFLLSTGPALPLK